MTSPAAGRQPAPVASSLTNSTNATGGIRSIFSATSYVAAAVAVALLGGFLFMSVMTQSPGDGNPAAGGSASPEAPSSVEPTQLTETQDEAGEDSATSPKEDDSLKLRTPMATALAIGLLASPAAVVTAQADLMAPAAVTGTASFYDEEISGSRQFADGALRFDGILVTSTWDSSDPRLSGDFAVTVNQAIWERLEMQIASGAVSLENDEGRWSGTASHLGGFELGETTMVSLRGDDAYEGLSARVVIDQVGENPPTLSAAIFPGEAPAHPGE